MQELEVLRAAKDLIAQGWVQGISAKRNARGGMSYCLTGALAAATDARTDLFISQQTVLFKEARKELYVTLNWSHPIERWNDELGRTQEQVLDALDRTIRRLEREQTTQEIVREDEEVMQEALTVRVREKKKTLVAV